MSTVPVEIFALLHIANRLYNSGMNMTHEQFDALARLLRMRGSPSQVVARLHYVDGMPVADAAREAGLSYNAAHQAIKRVACCLADAMIAAGRT